jgi:hypothetical protein
MMEILHALKKWCPYLIGRHFKVKIDHDSLKYFLDQRLSSEEQKKWVTKILGFDFEIVYKKGKIIVSDRDPIFTRHFWTELFSCLGTQLAHISSYHPQSDGKTKIVNNCLEGYLRCFVSDKQTQWFKWLPLVEWWYNTSFHTAKKMTPFMELYGYHPPSITSSLK